MRSASTGNYRIATALLVTAVCLSAATPAAAGAIIDQRGSVFGPSVARSGDKANVIAYVNGFHELRLARCTNAPCSQASVRTLVARRADFFVNSSMAVGSDGIPVIAFRNLDGRLVVARCSDTSCSRAQTNTISDAQYPFIGAPRIAVGADGKPIIAAVAGPQGGPSFLIVRHCKDVACKSSSVRVVDSPPRSDTFAITVDKDGRAVVSYVRALPAADELRTASCTNASCTTTDNTLLDTSPFPFLIRDISMTKSAEGRPLIAYTTSQLVKVAACTTVMDDPCGAATTSIVHENAGFYVSLTLGGDNNPLLAFYDETDKATEKALTVARCADSTCSAATRGAKIPSVASQFSLGVTSETPGLGLVAYVDPATKYLATAHCNDLACSTFSP